MPVHCTITAFCMQKKCDKPFLQWLSVLFGKGANFCKRYGFSVNNFVENALNARVSTETGLRLEKAWLFLTAKVSEGVGF